MKTQEDHLNEYSEQPKQRNTFYTLLVISLCSYFIYFAIDTFVDLGSVSWKSPHMDWASWIFSLIIPGAGFILLLMNYRIGWFISTLFFSFFFFALTAVAVSGLIKDWDDTLKRMYTGRWIALFPIATASICLLLTKNIRRRYNIKKWILITALLISGGFTFLVVYFG